MRLALFAALLLGGGIARADEGRLLRFPTTHGDAIAFTYAGNLYTVAAKGGIARRLTSHDGFEMFPHFAPDGKTLAFTGQYDGNTEVYTMPAAGGEPKRLTFTATLGRDDVSDRMGPNNIVMGWKRDGKSVLFRSRMHSFNDFLGQLFLVPADGGLAEELPLPRGGFASYSPDDKQLVYNRVFREFRTWKRYRGGMADEIWLHDFATKQTTALTTTPAQEIHPMWAGDRVYFLSDRDEPKRMNLYSLDPKTKAVTRHTEFTEYDIKFPTLGDKAIVFEYAGYIYRFDLETKKAEKVNITLNDDGAGSRTALRDVSKSITDAAVSPDGKRVVFGARGDLFSVPAGGPGTTRNLTATPGTHEREPAYSPDGKQVAFISDVTGEDEIHLLDVGGDGPKPLTTGGDCYKFDFRWSPDGKKLAWSDRKQRLQYVDIAAKKIVTVTTAKTNEVRDYTWSPDSQWLAYAHSEPDTLAKVHLYSLATAKSVDVTDGSFASSFPAFSTDGKYLFFLSARDFNPTYGQTEFNHIYQDMTRVYLVPLAATTESPLKPKVEDEEAKPAAPAAASAAVTVKVDAEGLNDRAIGLPIAPANYRNLKTVAGGIYYLRQSSREPAPALIFFDLAGQREVPCGSISAFDISGDGKKLLAIAGGKFAVIDLPRGPVTVGDGINVGGLEVLLDRKAEWKQIYHECWRQMRDFFYDPGMHGVDWLAIRKKYEVLLPYVRHRADLTYVIGEMISELNVGHAYVGGGDLPEVKKIPLGLLGAELTRDPKTGYFRIAKILRGATWDRQLRAPLAEVGMTVKEGEYIVAVNGRPANEVTNPFELLVNTVGKQVTLKINSEPSQKGARAVTVTPIADESKLYYHEWVKTNAEKVSKATNGRVGYIHIPDMLQNGLNEFVKTYYPQLGKKALVIDVRGNGGGNVSPMVIERLRREIAMVGIARNSTPSVNPDGTFLGPMVCLLNEFSASDGDIFPYRFRHYKLGPLIGKRSWGGVVGIRGTLPLLDGGVLNRPEFSRYDVAGKEWIMEGHGVDPDIVVDNDPAKEYAGEDQQLNKGIDVVLELLKTKERNLPPAPAYPKKN